MDVTPTSSFDEENGGSHPPPKPEQPIMKDYAGVVDVTKPTDDLKKETKNVSRRYILAMLLLAGLVVVAIAIPLVKNYQRSSSSSNASAAGVAASGGDEDDETKIFDEESPTLVGDPGASTPVKETTSTPFVPLWDVSDSIGLYDESILQGYASTEDLQSDLTVVAKMMVNAIAESCTGRAWLENSYNYNSYGEVMDDAVVWDTATAEMANNNNNAMAGDMAEEEQVQEVDMPDMADPAMLAVGKAVKNDFGANNQEAKIEEGDKMVSDGTRVFAAYGDSIIVWDVAMGKQLAMERMENFWTNEQTEPSTSITNNTEIQGDDGVYYYEPTKPTIMSLLLVNSRLIVAVDGGYYYPMEPVAPEDERILSNYGQTRVLIYETEFLTLDPNDGETVLGSMERVFSRDYDGVIVGFRAIGDNLHTVTTSQVNAYAALQDPVQRYHYDHDQTLTDQEYLSLVKADAETKLIPNFVEKLTKELTMKDGSLPKLTRISKTLTHAPAPGMDYMQSSTTLSSVTMVHSLNIVDTTMTTESSSSASGLFTSSYSSQVYSAQDYMIIAGTGQDYSPSRMTTTESTYLMAMKLNGAESTPHSIGTVEGTFLNPRSFDVVDNVLRVATTIQRFWQEPMPMMDTDMVVAEDVGSATNLDEEQSSTENYITTLKLPGTTDENPGKMQELGRIKLGKANETFTSVRFYDNVAYAVTYLYTDPFYVLNVTDPSNLQVLAEVNITGFSSYLHSINDENNMIVAIGQEMDESTMSTLGLQVSLFDVRDLNNVKVSRHMIEQDLNMYSDTAATWDVMAVRFNRETGRLIIPVDMTSCEYPPPVTNFHGFRIYSVTENGIQEDASCGSIAMGMANKTAMAETCYSCSANLSPRAMIVNDNMMFTKDHFVKSVSMNNCTVQWKFAVNNTSRDASEGCCGLYY